MFLSISLLTMNDDLEITAGDDDKISISLVQSNITQATRIKTHRSKNQKCSIDITQRRNLDHT